MGAGQDLDEGALPRAVLPEQRVHLPAAQVQPAVADGADAGERLLNAEHFQERRVGHFFSLSRYSGRGSGLSKSGSCAQFRARPLTLTLSPEYRGEGTRAHRVVHFFFSAGSFSASALRYSAVGISVSFGTSSPLTYLTTSATAWRPILSGNWTG